MAGRGWTNEEVRLMRNMYPHVYARAVADKLGRSVKSIYSRAAIMRLGKSDEFKSSEASRRLSLANQPGRNRRFKPGHIPANAGKKWQEFRTVEGHKKCLKTAFYKGHQPHNTKHDGDVVIRPNTAVRKFIRISKGNWMELHRLVWIVLYGDIPAGKVLRCKTSDTLNCDPSNWELTDRKDHLAKNNGREKMTDEYIALVLARRDSELRKELLKMPEILEIKRLELTLKHTIDERSIAD